MRVGDGREARALVDEAPACVLEEAQAAAPGHEQVVVPIALCVEGEAAERVADLLEAEFDGALDVVERPARDEETRSPRGGGPRREEQIARRHAIDVDHAHAAAHAICEAQEALPRFAFEGEAAQFRDLLEPDHGVDAAAVHRATVGVHGGVGLRAPGVVDHGPRVVERGVGWGCVDNSCFLARPAIRIGISSCVAEYRRRRGACLPASCEQACRQDSRRDQGCDANTHRAACLCRDAPP